MPVGIGLLALPPVQVQLKAERAHADLIALAGIPEPFAVDGQRADLGQLCVGDGSIPRLTLAYQVAKGARLQLLQERTVSSDAAVQFV